MKHHFIFFLLFLALPARAGSLPSGLAPTEIDIVVQTLGFAHATRLMRSAEAYPSWPGIKMGMELVLSSSRDIGALGNRDGSVPSLNTLPRIYLAKGLFENLELVFSFLPMNSPAGVATTGGILKWGFYTEKDTWLSGSAYFGYTRVKAYNLDYEGSDVEFGVSFSKDYVRLKPFLGAGILFATGSVRPALARTAVRSSLQTTLHLFLGAEVELPVNLTFQVELMNLVPMGTLFVGKKF